MVPQGPGFPPKALPQIQSSPTLKTAKSQHPSKHKFRQNGPLSQQAPGEGQTETPWSHYLRSSSSSLSQDFNDVTASSRPHFSLIFFHSVWEAGPCRRATTPAYLSELLHASKNPHHTINLLFQAPGPVLHPASRGERDVRRACWSCSCNNPFLATQGNQGSYSLNPIFTREGADRRRRGSLWFFPFDVWPGGIGFPHTDGQPGRRGKGIVDALREFSSLEEACRETNCSL